MTKRVPKSAAVLTINEAPKMNARGRQQVARWLHKQADTLVLDGKNYSDKVFTARYIVAPELNASSKKPKGKPTWQPRKADMIRAAFKPPAVRSPRKRYGR